MYSLALDTSTSLASVGCGRDGALLAESQISVRATHSESVLPEIDRLLRACGIQASDLNELIVGAGPGSFTGVRIAASFAKGICFASGAQLYAYSSLAAVAAGAAARGPVCALFDARRGQVYGAGYTVDDTLREIFAPQAAALDDLLATLDVEDWWFTGDGVEAGRREIEGRGGRILGRETWFPRAAALLRLHSVAPEAGLVSDVRTWEPVYVRLPAAQRELRD